MTMQRIRERANDQRGLSRSLLLAIVLFALMGVLVIDGGSLLFANFQMHDAAAVGAREGATLLLKGSDRNKACEAAALAVTTQNTSLMLNCDAEKDFKILDSGEVTVTLRKTPATVVLGRFGPTKEWTNLVVTETALPSTL